MSPKVAILRKEEILELAHYVIGGIDLNGLKCPHISNGWVVLEDLVDFFHLSIDELGREYDEGFDVVNYVEQRFFDLFEEDKKVCLPNQGELMHVDSEFADIVLDAAFEHMGKLEFFEVIFQNGVNGLLNAVKEELNHVLDENHLLGDKLPAREDPVDANIGLHIVRDC